jgi:hypothetical protein
MNLRKMKYSLLIQNMWKQCAYSNIWWDYFSQKNVASYQKLKIQTNYPKFSTKLNRQTWVNLDIPQVISTYGSAVKLTCVCVFVFPLNCSSAAVTVSFIKPKFR